MSSQIDLTPALLAELRAAVEGCRNWDEDFNWKRVCDCNWRWSVEDRDGNPIAKSCLSEYATYFVAANPAVVLALIARIEELELEVMNWNKAIERSGRTRNVD